MSSHGDRSNIPVEQSHPEVRITQGYDPIRQAAGSEIQRRMAEEANLRQRVSQVVRDYGSINQPRTDAGRYIRDQMGPERYAIATTYNAMKSSKDGINHLDPDVRDRMRQIFNQYNRFFRQYKNLQSSDGGSGSGTQS